MCRHSHPSDLFVSQLGLIARPLRAKPSPLETHSHLGQPGPKATVTEAVGLRLSVAVQSDLPACR